MVPIRDSANNVQHSEEPIDNVKYSLGTILQSKYHIVYININSLENKLDDLELLLHRLRNKRGIDVHIVAITEVKINEETTKFCNLTDYNSFFSTNLNGDGGVALFIHKSLPSGIIKIQENGNVNCLLANIPKLELNVGIFHAQPFTTLQSLSIANNFKSVLCETQRLILFSDINIDLLLSSKMFTKRCTDAIKAQEYSILNKIDAVSDTKARLLYVLSNIKQFNYTYSLRDVSFSDNKIIVLGFDDQKPEKIDFITEPYETSYKVVDYRKFEKKCSRICL